MKAGNDFIKIKYITMVLKIFSNKYISIDNYHQITIYKMPFLQQKSNRISPTIHLLSY